MWRGVRTPGITNEQNERPHCGEVDEDGNGRKMNMERVYAPRRRGDGGRGCLRWSPVAALVDATTIIDTVNGRECKKHGRQEHERPQPPHAGILVESGLRPYSLPAPRSAGKALMGYAFAD